MVRLPADLLGNVLSYLDAGDIKNLHQTCSRVRDDTMAVVCMPKRGLFHYELGNKIHQLEMQRNHLDECYRKYKCRGEYPSWGYSRANKHSDFEIYDKCIRVSKDWRWDSLKSVCDSIASQEGIPMHYYGHPRGDVYYNRHETLTEPIKISEERVFAIEDITAIGGFVDDLIKLYDDVVKLSSTFHGAGHGKLIRSIEVLRKRRDWIHKTYWLLTD